MCNDADLGQAFELLEAASVDSWPLGRRARSWHIGRRARARDLQVAVFRGFFTPTEVEAVHRLAHCPEVKVIRDRDEDLFYRHLAYRVENQLRNHQHDIYDRLMRTARALDNQLWQAIRPRDCLEPEIEYIVYDTAQLRGPGRIAPHFDNESKVSMIIMLSDTSEFEGGVNCFEGNSEDNPRMAKLQRGDAIFFHGEACLHWITPVTSGRRVILQMELSSGHSRCNMCIFLVFAMLFVFMPTLTAVAGTMCWRIWTLLPVVLIFEVWLGAAIWRAHRPEHEQESVAK